MKTKRELIARVALAMLAACGPLAVTASALVPGDSEQDVRRELGEPAGRMQAGSHAVYLYERGRVEMDNGIVTEVAVVSEEAALERREEQERLAVERARVAAERLEQRRAEGERLLADTLADASFLAQPASVQLAFWDTFRRDYPDIDIRQVYPAVVEQYEAELEQVRIRAQLAELERRAAEAEARARAAEQAAEEARNAQSTVTYVSYPTVVEYPRSYYGYSGYSRYTVTVPPCDPPVVNRARVVMPWNGVRQNPPMSFWKPAMPKTVLGVPSVTRVPTPRSTVHNRPVRVPSVTQVPAPKSTVGRFEPGPLRGRPEIGPCDPEERFERWRGATSRR